MDPDQEQALAIHMNLAEQAKASGTPGVVTGLQYRSGDLDIEKTHVWVTGEVPNYIAYLDFAELNVPQQMQARLLHSRNVQPSSSIEP